MKKQIIQVMLVLSVILYIGLGAGVTTARAEEAYDSNKQIITFTLIDGSNDAEANRETKPVGGHLPNTGEINTMIGGIGFSLFAFCGVWWFIIRKKRKEVQK